jgi:hypothetical protein
MKIRNNKLDKTYGYNSFKKLFLLSNNFKEPKVQKDWFIDKYKDYISTIKTNVDNFLREENFSNFKKDFHINSISHKKNSSPETKLSQKNLITNGNSFNLRKFISNKKLNYLNNSDVKKNSTFTNMFNHYKNNTLNMNKSIDRKTIKKYSYENKFILDLDSLPNIQGIENKNKYLIKNINNISEETDSLEKKLIKKEKMKYFGFKSKYNRLFNESKRVQEDINQYLYPQRDKRFKFNLNYTNDGLNEGERNITHLMKTISKSVKNKEKNKLSVSEIKKEVELFKNREKRLRERIKKSHAKFYYLITDSNIIQKRIDIKCQKNNDLYD